MNDEEISFKIWDGDILTSKGLKLAREDERHKFKKWLEDLNILDDVDEIEVFNKSYHGLYLNEIISKKIAELGERK